MAIVSGSLSSVAMGYTFTPVPVQNGFQANITSPAQFNVSVSGTFAATWQIVRSIDGGNTYAPISSFGVPYSFTGLMSETFAEPQVGGKYAISVTAYTSGTLYYAFGQ